MTEIKIVDTQSTPAAGMEIVSNMAEVSKVIGQAYGQIMAYLGQNGIQPAGMPFVYYPEMSPDAEGRWKMIPGFPTTQPIQGADSIQPLTLPATQAATAIHMGPYETLEKTYAEMMSWIKENGYELNGPMWEYYFTDPQSEPDTSKWRTDIYIPVKKAA
ncbi:MAG: GyrI-like domain-containing protein [Candidatus Saccharibacteria bacterium]